MNMHDSKTLKTTKKPAAAPRTKDELLGKATRWLQRPAAQDARGRGCPKREEVPACKNGVKDATTSPKKFKRLVESLPNFNLGVATGEPSDIVVIDIDPRNGGNETLAALKRKLGQLPETVTVNTGGGGTHLYFEAPKKRLRSAMIGKNVWIATLPRAWRDFIANPGRKTASPKTGPEQNAIPEGNRNNELTRIAGQMRRAGLTEAEILDVLSTANKRRCNPSLERAEVIEIAHNVAQYPAGNALQPADAGEQLAQAVLDHHFNGGANLRYEKDGQFWRWDGKHWAALDDRFLQRLILDTAKTLPDQSAYEGSGPRSFRSSCHAAV